MSEQEALWEATGEEFEVDDSTSREASLPEKVEGEHRWIATAAYVVPDVEADQVALSEEHLLDIAVGCIDCERPWQQARKLRCDADPYTGFDRE